MSKSTTTTHTSSQCADFFEPVREALLESGIEPMGRFYPPNSRQDFHSGWRGRWRSFRSGYENHGLVYYCEVGIATGADSYVGLDIRHPNFLEVSERLYRSIRQDFNGIALSTYRPSEGGDLAASIWLSRPGNVWDRTYHRERTQSWMSETLIEFRDKIQPVIDQTLGQ